MINPRRAWNEIGSSEIWTGQTVAWNEGFDGLEESVVFSLNPSLSSTNEVKFSNVIDFLLQSGMTSGGMRGFYDEVQFTLTPATNYLSTYNFEFEAVFTLGTDLGLTLQAVFDAIESFPLQIAENVLAGKFIYDQVALSLRPDLSSTALKEYSESVNFLIRGFDFAAEGQGVYLEFAPMQIQVGVAEASFALYDNEVEMTVSSALFGFSGREQVYSISVGFHLGADMFMKNFQWGRTAPTFGDWDAPDAGQSNNWTPDAPTFGSWN